MDAAATYAGSFFISSDSETVQDFLEFLCVFGYYFLFDFVAIEEEPVQIRICCRYGVFQAIYKQIIHRYVERVCYVYKYINAGKTVAIFDAIDVYSGLVNHFGQRFLGYVLIGSEMLHPFSELQIIYGHVFLLSSARISTDISSSEFRT